MSNWTRYYDATGDEPRETLLQALERFDRPGFAVDLGCGSGRDTVELLARRWRVLAIDSEAEAIRRLRSRVGEPEELTTQVAAFEDATWPSCDLVNASWSLPFCPPSAFPRVWERIVGALRADGRFCGQLFGERDGWAPADDITFHTRAEAEALLAPFAVERFDEIEEDSMTALGDPKHWHVFHVIARKR